MYLNINKNYIKYMISTSILQSVFTRPHEHVQQALVELISLNGINSNKLGRLFQMNSFCNVNVY